MITGNVTFYVNMSGSVEISNETYFDMTDMITNSCHEQDS